MDKPMMGVLFLVGVLSGLRIGDLLSLKVADVGQQFIVKESKTSKKKHIALDIAPWYVLDAYIGGSGLKPHDRLFPVSRQTVHKYFKRAAQDLGITSPIGTHTMRKTYGWNVWRMSKCIDTVRRAYNHKYVSTTVQYLLDGFVRLSDIHYGNTEPTLKPSYEHGKGSNCKISG